MARSNLNGWALRILVGVGATAFVVMQGWSASELNRLGEVTGRLDERVAALTKQMERINTTDALIRALEEQANAGKRTR